MIHLAMPTSEVFGAGTCGKYLLREFALRGDVILHEIGEPLDGEPVVSLFDDVNAPLLQFSGPDLEQQTKYRGSPNAAYIFSEWEPVTEKQKENLKAFDVLLAGSEWNAQVIRDAGFSCTAVQQGVDREIFKPAKRLLFKDRFVIYSGGKFEHRKAQDLVIRAVKILQQKHSDILLVASWVNIWGEDGHGELVKERIESIHLPLISHKELADYMAQTDVGLFPNRREGGTNLVMMDYLACGKPVIANVSTGQKDVLEKDYAVMIEGKDDQLVEQMVESVLAFYDNRPFLASMGGCADRAMHKWSWSRTADKIMGALC